MHGPVAPVTTAIPHRLCFSQIYGIRSVLKQVGNRQHTSKAEQSGSLTQCSLVTDSRCSAWTANPLKHSNNIILYNEYVTY